MVVAHAGHWLANLAYAAPVIVLVGWLGVVRAKEALAGRREVEKQPPGD
jgi:hypothetical protein